NLCRRAARAPPLRPVAQNAACAGFRLRDGPEGMARMAAVNAGENGRDAMALSTEELIARVVGLSQDMRAHVVGAVDRMQDINRGIHLLSMNARIEAARAGAAGAGFGVVGQE